MNETTHSFRRTNQLVKNTSDKHHELENNSTSEIKSYILRGELP